MRIKQKEKIVLLLRAGSAMTQGELAEAIYGDSFHTSNIYSALMALVNEKVIMRLDGYPARYSIYGTSAIQRTARQDCAEQASCDEIEHQTMTMSAECAVNLIRAYFEQTMSDPHGRYLSWVHCYKAFLENRDANDEQAIDHLALHLAFYLASWGMYRGSSFLLQKDYKVHIPVVKIIQEKKYDPLVGICAKDLCKEQNLALLEDIGERICECYAAEGPAIDGKVNAASDTLITKILLGTLGCVPAYDRYYKESVKKYHISSGKYNSDSVYRVAKFYCDHEDEFERLRLELSERRIEYPPMKLMDMCFWQDAYISDSKAATIQRIE